MYAVVTDIPGDFLHADMVGTVYLILEGEVSEAIVNLEPETYKKFLWYSHKGKAMLYVQLKDALYGTLQLYYSGSYCLTHNRSGASKLMTTTDV